jgi:hypothetical protein
MHHRRYVLEVLADIVTLAEPHTAKEPVLIGDVRLSFCLSDFPVLHIKPSASIPLDSELGRFARFGGAGKLCELHLSKGDFERINITFLFLKEIPSISDYLILCMTAPISFRDVVLSLPSCKPQPYVKRRFEFIDGRGSCEVFLRLTAVEPPAVIRRLGPTGATLTSGRDRGTSATFQESRAKIEEQSHDEQKKLSSSPRGKRQVIYGGLKNRTPFIV